MIVFVDKLQDILENKLEKRPNRELLVQKNILPDSKAAPLLQLKCNELKRARLADDLNEKLAKRPGPLELVESGILVSSDSSLTEAIKDGKIVYPRTSSIIPRHHAQHEHFTLDESNLNLNFNFTNLTDNDDSNASQTSTSTTRTNNTLASLSSSSVNSFNFFNNQNQQQQQQTQLNLNTDLLTNLNDQQSNAASPASSTLSKNMPSPFSLDSPSKLSTKSSSNSQFNRKLKSSLSSCSSSTSSSSKSNKKVLIFHEYRGPNQKSSKTSISVKSSSKLKSSQTKSNPPSSPNNQTDLFIQDSNDSQDSNFSPQENELDAYKIRLEQQKMFLQYNKTETNLIEPKKEPIPEPQAPIQLVPIGDVHMLDNLKNLISSGIRIPIRTITLSNEPQTSNQIFSIDPGTNLTPVLIAAPPVTTTTVQQPIQIQVENQSEELPLNLEELSVSKLREECAKRKLSKTGVKQKLIERLKNNQKVNVAKSPDSGVNMDSSSPSLVSCEPSPCGSNVSTNTAKQQQQQQQQQVKQNNNENSRKNSLDDFFEFLNVESMGKNEIENLSNQLKLDTFKTEEKKEVEEVKENYKDLSQTALNLEMSLKSSAELLKQLSSAGHIEHLHKLEKQMQQSMQLIEKLKLASSKQQLNQETANKIEKEHSVSDLNDSNYLNLNNKLRVVNSMPSNLRDLGLISNHTFINIQPHKDLASSKEIYMAEKINIPVEATSYQHLTTTANTTIQTDNKQVTFGLQDNETQVQTQTTQPLIQHQHNLSLNLYSNGSCSSSSSSSSSASSTSSSNPTHNPNQIEMEWNDSDLFQLCQDFDSTDQTSSKHMTEVDKLENSNNFFNYIDLNQQQQQAQYLNLQYTNINTQSKTCDPLIAADSNIILPWEILEPDYNQLMAGYLQNPTI